MFWNIQWVNNTAENAFGKFYADQLYGNDYTGNSRKQARFSAFRDHFFVMDGDGDSNFTRGFRFGFSDYNLVQFMPRTALFGTPKAASYEPTFYPRAQFDVSTQ